MLDVRVVTNIDFPVDRFQFERVCRRALVGCTASVHYVSGCEAAAEVRAARYNGDPVLLCGWSDSPPADLQAAAIEPSLSPVVWLDLNAALQPRQRFLDPASVLSIRGRGLEGVAWGMRSLVARSKLRPTPHRYGADIEQMGDLRLPVDGEPPWPVFVLIHGGGWRERWERDLMDGIATDLTCHGFATWNIEFRRVGASGGGWPGTFLDVAASIDYLRELEHDARLDLERVVTIGHSAGGHLAAWAGARPRLPADAPGAIPAVGLVGVVTLAGVFDLISSAQRGLDELSTIAMVGGMPSEYPERYALASPAELLPNGADQLVIVGLDDRPDLIDDNRRYAERARAAGDRVELMELPDADHFSVIDPQSRTWLAIRDRLLARFTNPEKGKRFG